MVYSESRERRRVKHKRKRVNTPCRMICPLSSRQVKYLKLDVDDACISF